MANEIIKIIEYITGNPFVQGAFIAYIIIGAIVLALAITIFIITFRAFFKMRKR